MQDITLAYNTQLSYGNNAIAVVVMCDNDFITIDYHDSPTSTDAFSAISNSTLQLEIMKGRIKGIAMAQWVNCLWNNSFVNPPLLPLLCKISGALHFIISTKMIKCNQSNLYTIVLFVSCNTNLM